jgi:hypothetical protein
MRYSVGNAFLPYRNTTLIKVNELVRDAECRYVPKQRKMYIKNMMRANDINVHLLNMGFPTGSCGTTSGECIKVCPSYSVCTNNDRCQRINNYLDLENSRNIIYRDCMTDKDTNCIKRYFGNIGILA